PEREARPRARPALRPVHPRPGAHPAHRDRGHDRRRPRPPGRSGGQPMKITDAVALVTGANRGIGASLVRELLARGVGKVYATARRPDTLPEIAPEPRNLVVPLALDVTDPSLVAAASAAARDVTLLVNNAGTLTPGSSAADAERDLSVNVLG